MVNFKIIENDDTLDQLQEEFISMYRSGVKVTDICQRLDITNSQYQNFRRKLNRRGFNLRRSKCGRPRNQPREVKNYFFLRDKGVYVVRRCNQYYAYFKTEEQARKYVDLMRECDWDYNRRLELKERVLNE